MTDVSILLMFEGRAEEAMNFYVSLIPESNIEFISRFGDGEPGPEGSIRQAVFSIANRKFRCIDSFVHHDFTFTPATTVHISTDIETEVDRIFNALAIDGSVLMPLNAYPFSKKFGWVTDRFGVSWQINLNA